MKDIHKMRYCVVSYEGYPGGGGEAFLHQTMSWAAACGYKPIWLCFATRDGRPYERLKIENRDFGDIMQISGGLSQLDKWLRLLQPDLVHHQGSHRTEIVNACTRLRIPILTGYHFWTGAVDLDTETYNHEIEKNYTRHRGSPQLTEIIKNSLASVYVCSEFMRRVIRRVCDVDIPLVIHPASGGEVLARDRRGDYVTVINVHRLKGGEIFLELLRRLPSVPLLGVRYEAHSEELDAQIRTEIAKRPDCRLLEFTNDIGDVYRQTRILLIPSVVDETFCRVANEGLRNGIPMVTTGVGAIRDMLGEAARYIDHRDKDAWVKQVGNLYLNTKRLRRMSRRSLERYPQFCEEDARRKFTAEIERMYEASKARNIMLIVPWCDQGLGIQARNYYEALRDRYRVFIFSFCPYSVDDARKLQNDPAEWTGPTVYYSKNIREKITDDELVSCIQSWNIGKCLIPETCWPRVFEIAKSMRIWGVKCYAIPNIEIVRRDETYKHEYFYRILCNNRLCERIFKECGFGDRLRMVGYGIPNKTVDRTPSTKTRFLCLGGLNAFTRKHVLEVTQAYVLAQRDVSDIELTVTVQKFYNGELDAYLSTPGYRLITDHLSTFDIQSLYAQHDIVIQVSKQEGLGLGFYEALATGSPVLTLDTPPHNEVIHDGVNGWTIPCTHVPMNDNPQAFFGSAVFKIEDLATKIKQIANDAKKLPAGVRDTTYDEFREQFLQAID